jgi:UDP-N-acetylglucosamine--N-acetylmuramyl-(pentapeptide) pyrophosphoryl-undecaprenol N-acetylglucosamine transferase
MAEAYAAADVVISRAGATTLAELTTLGKPAILIPYPYAAGRHQEFNAMKLKEMGAAHVVLDHEISGKTIADHIRDLYGNASGLKDMQRASRGLGTPDACARIVDIALNLVKNSRERRKGT